MTRSLRLRRNSVPAVLLTTLVAALAAALGVLAVLAVPSSATAAGRSVVRFAHLPNIHDLAGAQRHLRGTSPAFQRFIAREGDEVRRENAGCEPRSGVYVEAFTRGYAIGGAVTCDGYRALWTNRLRGGAPGGAWRQVFSTPDRWFCAPLKRYRVPSDLVGTSCYSPAREAVIAYHQD